MPTTSWSSKEKSLVLWGLSIVLFILVATIAFSYIYVTYDREILSEFTKSKVMYRNYNAYISCGFNIFVSFMYYRLYAEFDSIKIK